MTSKRYATAICAPSVLYLARSPWEPESGSRWYSMQPETDRSEPHASARPDARLRARISLRLRGIIARRAIPLAFARSSGCRTRSRRPTK